MLRRGPEYRQEHVQCLARQIPGLVCLSDTIIPGVEIIPLQHNCPGWWAKMELFRPDIDGDLLYFDIDTVITGDISRLEVGKTTMLSDFYRPKQAASGLMYIEQKDKAAVWDHWQKDPAGHMSRAKTTQCWGDQGIIGEVIGNRQRWQDILPGAVVSYKVHCKRGPPRGSVAVCFHGKPRPWDSGERWIPKL